MQVNAANGVNYRRAKDFTAPHTAGTYAGPWYLAEAIRSSGHFTTDLNTADLVFVNDYCYYIHWLSNVHDYGDKGKTLHAFALNLAYARLLQHPRWKVNQGKDFIFYDSHPGFRGGLAGDKVMEQICGPFKQSIMLIPDRPMRTVCQTFFEMSRVLLVPFNPNAVELHRTNQIRLPMRTSLAERNVFVYFRASCLPVSNVGKAFRLYVGKSFEYLRSAEIDVSCINTELGGREELFESMQESMSRSRFCLILPGDSASTRRLGESMLAGCIPVFLGPPYHSMPFSHTINWGAAGVFFNISMYEQWLEDDFQWRLDPSTRVNSPQEARWWSPDADVYSSLVQVDSVDQVGQHASVHLCMLLLS